MEYEVIFSDGMEALDGARRCLLTRFVPESPALVLRDLESEDQLLLGDVRLVAPYYLPELDEREREALGMGDVAAEDILILCRMAVPYARPQEAGFDMSHFVCVHSGRGIEVRRPGAPVIPLVPWRDQ
ncbi:MAG: hypothetical protein IKJ34_00750 [Mailhella sp.]|nr:hypothetical protein [Mailhella sp.]